MLKGDRTDLKKIDTNLFIIATGEIRMLADPG